MKQTTLYGSTPRTSRKTRNTGGRRPSQAALAEAIEQATKKRSEELRGGGCYWVPDPDFLDFFYKSAPVEELQTYLDDLPTYKDPDSGESVPGLKQGPNGVIFGSKVMCPAGARGAVSASLLTYPPLRDNGLPTAAGGMVTREGDPSCSWVVVSHQSLIQAESGASWEGVSKNHGLWDRCPIPCCYTTINGQPVTMSRLFAGDEGKKLLDLVMPVHELIIDELLAPGAPVGLFSVSARGSPVDIELAKLLKRRGHPVHVAPHPEYPLRGSGEFEEDASGNKKAFAGHAVAYDNAVVAVADPLAKGMPRRAKHLALVVAQHGVQPLPGEPRERIRRAHRSKMSELVKIWGPEYGFGSGGESQLQLDARAAHGFGGGEVSMKQKAAAGYTGTTDTIRALLQKLQGVVTLDEIYTECLSKPFGKEEKKRVVANLATMKDVERVGRGLYKLKK